MGVKLRNITKGYKGTTVLSDVSLDVPAGQVIGLRGINGSGKTMLMRVACGLVRPDEGVVEVDGVVIGRDIDFPPSLGLLIEGPAFLDARSGLDNLWLLARLRRIVSREDVARAMKRVGLDPALRKPYRTYSLGMKQRLGIAAAIMEQPKVLMLDEPTNALDAEGVELATRIIREERDRGAAVLVACHDASILEAVADEIVCMRDGRVASEGGASWGALR